jgi:putative pyruvate formate lyase activating enzyme
VERRRRLGWIKLAVAAHRLAGGHRLDAHPATCELVEHGLRRAKLAVGSALVLQPGHAAGLYSRSERYSRRTSRMAKQEPSSLALARSGVLAERARDALELLAHRCRVCPRECTVDRLADERGLCRIGRRAVVASHFPHFGEENCLRGWKGSGTIFFSGCNLRCVFCQNFDVSWQVQGEEVSRERLAAMMLELQGLGCHNINWVTPEHVVPQILEALPLALAVGLRLPIVYNTSSYDSLDSCA